MKLTPDRKEELRVWVYKVWNFHWRELAPKSNSRAQFQKYVERDNFNDTELARIELAIVAQTKHWRNQNKIERVIGIPCLSVWYNQNRYDDEFIDESAIEMKDREQLKTCAVNTCSSPVIGSNYQYCHLHIPSVNDKRYVALVKAKEEFNKLGIQRGSPDFAKKCREYAVKQGFIIG